MVSYIYTNYFVEENSSIYIILCMHIAYYFIIYIEITFKFTSKNLTKWNRIEIVFLEKRIIKIFH